MDRPPRGPRRPSTVDGSNSLNRARDTVSVSVPEGEDCNRRPLSAADATTTRQLAPRPEQSCCSARCRRSSCTAALLTSTSTEMETGPSTRFVGSRLYRGRAQLATAQRRTHACAHRTLEGRGADARDVASCAVGSPSFLRLVTWMCHCPHPIEHCDMLASFGNISVHGSASNF